MSKTDKFMPLYVSDYLADTMHLTTAEHGAYLLLIMHYWRSRRPLPRSDAQLSRIAKATDDEWKTLKKSVLPFFEKTPSGYFHARIAKEISRAEEIYNKRSESGKLGNSKRWGSQTGSQTDCKTVAGQSHLQPHIFINKNRARAAARDQTAAPPAHVEDWADEFPQWRSFKASLHPTEWATWFADARPNGSTASLVAETPFQRDRVAAQYLPRLLSHFGKDFKLKLKGE